MLNLLTKSYFTFKLYWGRYIVDCKQDIFTDSLCLYEYSKMIGLKRKRNLFRSGKVEMSSTFQRSRHFRKVLVKKTFMHVQEQKKAMSPRHSAYTPSSVKSPLNPC